MPVRIAIVGPGRVGRAFAARFARASADVLGFVGRDEASAEAAARETGCGAALAWSDLARAHCVVFSVGDGQLRDAVAAAAAAGGRRCSLWLHTSGRHDLGVFDPAASLGVRVGSLHPLAPFPGSLDDPPISGAPAVCQGAEESRELLGRLCEMLQLRPVFVDAQNRALYHAACALAANGATALFGLAAETLRAAGGLRAEDAARVVAGLMSAAAAGAAAHGAAAALSGPVRRGDDATVALHLQELSQHAPSAEPAYRALMAQAVHLAAAEGLSEDALERLERLLGGGGAS